MAVTKGMDKHSVNGIQVGYQVAIAGKTALTGDWGYPLKPGRLPHLISMSMGFVFAAFPLWEILWLRETLNSLLIGIRSVL